MQPQIEKPFGKDLGSSRELQQALAPNWKEEEIFRIDHYLGKEMVKNILILRFGNEFFGATWNRNHIDNVQVSRWRFRGSMVRVADNCCRSPSRSLSAPRAEEDTLTSLVSSVMLCRTVRYPQQYRWTHEQRLTRQ